MTARCCSKVQQGEFPPPRASSRTCRRRLEAVCLKAMALKPEDRYAVAPRAWRTTSSIGWPTNR